MKRLSSIFAYVRDSLSVRISSCIFILCVVHCLGVHAAEWTVRMDNFTPTMYSGGTQNWQLCQQENGWIYAANNYGLLQYDGVDWRLFGLRNSTVIRSIALDTTGYIYAGGTNEFGYFAGNDKGGFQYHSLSDSLPDAYRVFGEVWTIETIDEYVYIQTHTCIFVYRRSEDNRLHYQHVVEPKMYIYLIKAFNKGLYVATSDGIYLLAGTHLNALQGSEQLRGYEIRSLAALDDRNLLIATDFNGIWCYDGTSVSRYVTEADAYLRKTQLYTLAVGDKYIAVGTVLKGLLLLDKDGRLRAQINRKHGLQNNTVLSLLFDKAGNLWLGLDQGIDYLYLNNPVRYLREDQLSYGSGYTSYLQGNTLYLGTNQGLYACWCHPETMKIGRLEVVDGSLGQVWNLQAVDGTLFCCHHRGLFVLEDKQLYPLMTEEGFWCVRKWKDGYILAGSYRGIYLLTKDGGQYRVLRRIQGFDDTSLHFEVDGQGAIWIVSHRGLERLTLNARMESFTAEMIHAMENEGDHMTIHKIDDRIVITGQNYCRVVSASGNVESGDEFFETLDGKKLYTSIWKDGDNNMWYQADNFLKIRKYDMHTRQYIPESYAIVCEPNMFIGGFPNLTLLPHERAILGGVNGFYFIHTPSRFTQPNHTHKVFIRKVTLQNKADEVIYGETFNTQQRIIELPYDSYLIRVDYGGCTVKNAGAMYSTRLVPAETEWSAYSAKSSREISNLRDGKYSLEVRMLLPQTNEVCSTQFDFVIATPWYRTCWAFVGYVCLFAVLVVVLVYLVRRLMERDKQRLNREKEQELAEQENRHKLEVHEQEVKILQLENERTQSELKNKSQELSNLLLTQVNRNELVSDLQGELRKVTDLLQDNNQRAAIEKLRQLQAKLGKNKESEIDWKRFEENFDVVHNQFLKRLSTLYPWMTKNERKLCIYIRMGLYTKEIAPLMNLSTRGVEMMRYRIRQKMGLDAQANLKQYFATLTDEPVA